MDAEHEECERALNALAERRDANALEGVISALETHFKHEEELLDRHLYAAAAAKAEAGEKNSSSAGGAFSLEGSERESHWNDHRRILSSLRKARALLKGSADAKLPVAFVAAAMRDFSTHAERYDDNYGDRLAAALTADEEAKAA